VINGDEGKPMSFMESITDEPCEIDPYLDYLLDLWRGHEEYWRGAPNDRDPDKATARECVLAKIQTFIRDLEAAKRKLHRHDPPLIVTP
jgi:hypothetical protein